MIFERVEEINISNMPIIVHPWKFIKKLRIKNMKYEKVENWLVAAIVIIIISENYIYLLHII